METALVDSKQEIKHEVTQQCNNKNKRIDWVDWLKAIGIFLVTLGHSNCNQKIRKYIYSFHMPLFFIASGLTFRPEKYNNMKDLVKDKIKKLIIPYLCINIFAILFQFIYCTYMVNKEFNLPVILQGIIYGNDDIIPLVNGPSWFILTLFLGEILFWMINKIYKGDKRHLLTISILLVLIGYVEGITSRKILMVWHLNTVPVATALIIWGYLAMGYIKKNEDKLKKLNIIIPILLIGIGIYVSVWVNGNVSFGGNNYKSIILTYTSLIANVIGISLILMKIKKSKFLSFIGKNSLIILAIHKPIIYILRYFIPSFKIQSWTSTGIGIAMFFGMIPFVWFIKKFLPFIVGDFSKYKLPKLNQKD